LSHKLVGEWRSLAYHYTLTTGYHQNSNSLSKLKDKVTVGNAKCYFIKYVVLMLKITTKCTEYIRYSKIMKMNYLQYFCTFL